MKNMKWACATALAAALLTGLAPSASATSPTQNWVRNTGTVGIGAIEVFDGSYKHDPPGYDDILQPSTWSGYKHTAGFYVGTGYCVRVRGWYAGTPNYPPAPEDLSDPQIVGAGWWEFTDVYPGYDVRALPIGDASCHSPAPSTNLVRWH